MRVVRAFVAAAVLVVPCLLLAEQVPVRHTEGLVHGFLALRTLDGATLAHGELIQTARGTRVTTRLIFHFKDGSLHDETAILSQRQNFRLLSHHLVQRGPAFKPPIEMSIDAVKGTATVRYITDDGERKVESEQFDPQPDLANGLVSMLLKNIDPNSPPKSLAYVAATPKPRLVRLAITAAGNESFTTGGGGALKATHYVLKAEIGGIAGVLAPLVGKQPPDVHVWILGGQAPAFVKSELPLYTGGPIWRIELVSPVRQTTK